MEPTARGRSPFTHRVARIGALAVGAMLILAGCALFGDTDANPAPTASGPASTEPGEPPAPQSDPELDLEGTAADNLPYFDLVNARAASDGGELETQRIADELIAAGFPAEAIEVTPDRTPTGLRVDSIQLGVRFGEDCLIGQHDRDGGYASTVAATLVTGRCLIGATADLAG